MPAGASLPTGSRDQGIGEISPRACAFDCDPDVSVVLESQLLDAEQLSEGCQDVDHSLLVGTGEHPIRLDQHHSGEVAGVRGRQPSESRYRSCSLRLVVLDEESDQDIRVNADHFRPITTATITTARSRQVGCASSDRGVHVVQ